MPDLFTAKTMILGPRFMHDTGCQDYQAAGCYGNLGLESGGYLYLQELAHSHGHGGWGLGQWTGPRRTAMLNWCAAHKFSPSSDEGNYGFLLHELQTTEAGALAALKRARTLEDATIVFMKRFERPGTPNLRGRLAYARKALTAIRMGLGSHQAGLAKAAAPAPAPRPAARRKPIADKHRGHH